MMLLFIPIENAKNCFLQFIARREKKLVYGQVQTLSLISGARHYFWHPQNFTCYPSVVSADLDKAFISAIIFLCNSKNNIAVVRGDCSTVILTSVNPVSYCFSNLASLVTQLNSEFEL